MSIDYRVNAIITVEQFRDLLHRSQLATRRPVDDTDCLQGMLKHADLCISAWLDRQLIGIARSVTDFHYCCYLSDLAVDPRHKRSGFGRQLQIRTQRELGPHCKLILIAAPDADSYYGHIGYTRSDRCWILPRRDSIEF